MQANNDVNYYQLECTCSFFTSTCRSMKNCRPELFSSIMYIYTILYFHIKKDFQFSMLTHFLVTKFFTDDTLGNRNINVTKSHSVNQKQNVKNSKILTFTKTGNSLDNIQTIVQFFYSISVFNKTEHLRENFSQQEK